MVMMAVSYFRLKAMLVFPAQEFLQNKGDADSCQDPKRVGKVMRRVLEDVGKKMQNRVAEKGAGGEADQKECNFFQALFRNGKSGDPRQRHGTDERGAPECPKKRIPSAQNRHRAIMVAIILKLTPAKLLCYYWRG